MVATRGRVPQPAKGSTREERGVALARERFEEIVKVRPWTLSVPSSDGSKAYEVNAKFERCSCPDAVNRPEGEPCKHVVAVRWIKAKTSVCAGCSVRRLNRELIELDEDNHDNLTYFHGDLLCGSCARAAGVL